MGRRLKTQKSLVLIVLLLISSILVMGCANTEKKTEYKLDPDNPIAVTVWHYYNSAQKRAFDEAVKEFNETIGYEKGIVVDAYSQGNVNELLQKVLDSAEKKVGADELPDMFAVYADMAYVIDQMGLSATLDEYFTEKELDEYVASYIAEGRIDAEGRLKIFPIAKSTEIMMLNKTDWDKFAKATNATVDQLETIEGVTAVAEAYYQWTDSLTEKQGDGKAFFGRDAIANYMIIGNRQLGNEIFQVKNGELAVNIDQEIYRKLWDNYYVPMMKGHFAANGRFRNDDAKTGDIIALVCSTAGTMYFPQQVTEGDSGSYPIEAVSFMAPQFDGAEQYAVQQGAGMMVLKSTPEQEYAAGVFLDWFTQDDRNIAFSTSTGYLPVKSSANDWEKIKESLDADEEITNAAFKVAMKAAIETVNSKTLYTNLPFEQGTEARAVLEDSMPGQIQRDLAVIQERMAEGLSRSEAIAPFISEEHFEQCYQEFVDQLMACCYKAQ